MGWDEGFTAISLWDDMGFFWVHTTVWDIRGILAWDGKSSGYPTYGTNPWDGKSMGYIQPYRL